VLEYVGRYTHRVAIANQRLLDIDDGHVRFHYKNYRAAAAQAPQTMTLEAPEFLRRFLLHVLPRGFHRIRYYGWLGHRHRTETLARCRRLLGTTTAPPPPGEKGPPSDYRDRYESLTGVSLRRCPACADGHMAVTLSWLPGCAAPVARPDTSMTRTRATRTVWIGAREWREGTRVSPASLTPACAHRVRRLDVPRAAHPRATIARPALVGSPLGRRPTSSSTHASIQSP
jgi:hypothetical protein